MAASFDASHFTHLLQQQCRMLREAIRKALLRGDAEAFTPLVNQAHETEDESLAELLADINTRGCRA